MDYYELDEALGRITKIINIEEFDNTENLINADDIMADVVPLKNVVVLMTCVTKDDVKFYRQLFLEEALYDEQI